MSGIRNLSTRREGFSWPLPEVVTDLNTNFINALCVWGHSYVDTINSVGTESQWQLANKLFSALGISWPLARNYGGGGTTIIEDWVRFVTTMRPAQDAWGGSSWTSQFGPQAFLYGYNDVIQLGDPSRDTSQGLNNWTNSWRAVLRWARSTALYPPNYIFGDATHAVVDSLAAWAKAGVTYAGTWTSEATPLFNANLSPQPAAYFAPHDTSYFTTSTSATVDIRLPPSYPATAVTMYVAGEVGANSGATSVTVSNPGGAMASFAISTNDKVRSPAYYGGHTARRGIIPITVTLPAGDGTNSQTLRLAPTAYAGGGRFTFFGWGIESIYPPLLVVANVPTTRENTAMTQANFSAYCNAYYNPGIATAAAECLPQGTVAVADLATAASGVTYPQYYSPNDLGGADFVHPNNAGKEVMVKEFLVTMNRLTLDVRHLIAPVTADEPAETIAMLTETQPGSSG